MPESPGDSALCDDADGERAETPASIASFSTSESVSPAEQVDPLMPHVEQPKEMAEVMHDYPPQIIEQALTVCNPLYACDSEAFYQTDVRHPGLEQERSSALSAPELVDDSWLYLHQKLIRGGAAAGSSVLPSGIPPLGGAFSSSAQQPPGPELPGTNQSSVT